MNEHILSQEEVDALLQGITGESQKLEGDTNDYFARPLGRPAQPEDARPHADFYLRKSSPVLVSILNRGTFLALRKT